MSTPPGVYGVIVLKLGNHPNATVYHGVDKVYLMMHDRQYTLSPLEARELGLALVGENDELPWVKRNREREEDR